MTEQIKEALQKLEDTTSQLHKPITLIGTRAALKAIYGVSDKDIDRGEYYGYKISVVQNTYGGVIDDKKIFAIGKGEITRE